MSFHDVVQDAGTYLPCPHCSRPGDACFKTPCPTVSLLKAGSIDGLRDWARTIGARVTLFMPALRVAIWEADTNKRFRIERWP